MKKKRAMTVLLILLAALTAYGAYQAAQVGDHLQYLVSAPELVQVSSADDGQSSEKPNQGLVDSLTSLKEQADGWSNAISNWTMGGLIDETVVSVPPKEGTASGEVCLELMGENAFAVQQKFLLYGRLFYEDELKRGDRVMLVDEQLALKLYAVADPIDRIAVLNGEEYRIVGVLRHEKRVGDHTDMGACIPLMSLLEQQVRPDALLVEAVPITGAGANVAFTNTVKQWKSGGTVIDLGKESMAATLWLRFLLFLIGLTVMLRMIRFLNRAVKQYHVQYRAALQRMYAVRLLPQLIRMIGLFAVGYAVCAGALALLMNYLIRPVYTFPEWIPTVLVEWDDIAAAFWNVWQSPAAVVEYRTPELLRLRFFTQEIQLCVAGCGLILAYWYGQNRSQAQKLHDGLAILYHEKAAVTCVHTENRQLFETLGYVACKSSAERLKGKHRSCEVTTMLRIVDAEKALRLMPNSAREGSFVLRVTDNQLTENNRTYCITCKPEGQTVEEIERDFDLSLPIEALARLMYSDTKLQEYLESHADYDLKMRSPAMEGFFAHQMIVKGEL